ncbi:MAG TPA: alpha/beta hydrolase [Jatrophihabitantaceae bacterium]|nr:alpha/beta hydrolase [Jatrophihabitantaceae bacterium]
MTLPRRLVAAIALIALVAAACTQRVSGHPVGAPPSASGASNPTTSPRTTTPTPSISAPTPTPIAFRDCTQALVDAGAPIPPALKGKLTIGCGQLAVPLNYAHPSNAQIALDVIRIHDNDDAHPIGSLLTNPGGPGASGIEFVIDFLPQLPVQVLQKYDVIGFDPRGVSLSSPIHCLSDTQKDQLLAESPDMTTASGFAKAKAESKEISAACSSKYGSNLQYYNTENTARDMDQIRQAVGDPRMNYLGFSYGTELGWVYVHLFPKTARAIVLDGAVDPDTSGISQSTEQVQGFEQAFGQFAANCKTVSPCNQLGDPAQAVRQLTDTAFANPIPTKTDRKLTQSLAFTGILQAMYSKSLWPRLATGLISARSGDGTELLQLADSYNRRAADGTYSNILDANTTIGCNDSRSEPSDATIHATVAKWIAKFPVFGRYISSDLLSCQGWQPDRTPIPDPKAATPTKVLVVGNLHDPATPYLGAKDLAKDLGNAELLSWNGEGHTSYLQGSSCIDNHVNAYLLTLKLPPDNTTCPAK